MFYEAHHITLFYLKAVKFRYNVILIQFIKVSHQMKKRKNRNRNNEPINKVTK